MITYIYPDSEDPLGAFEWWLSPCGKTDLVPEEIKRVFDTLNQVSGGVGSFKPPKNLRKGSGKKGDKNNPRDRSTPRSQPSSKPDNKGGNCKVSLKPQQRDMEHEEGSLQGPRPPCKPRPCKVPPRLQQRRIGRAKRTIQRRICVGAKTETHNYAITSLVYAQNARPVQVLRDCKKTWSQACFHYSSVIWQHPQYATITCPHAAATTSKIRTKDSPAIRTWHKDHNGKDWRDPTVDCDRDEYPPAYLLDDNDPVYVRGGEDGAGGQLVRYLPDVENRGAGGMWAGICFMYPILQMSDQEFMRLHAVAKHTVIVDNTITVSNAKVTVTMRPQFSISAWGQMAAPPKNDGLYENPCWPSAKAAGDPGFALLKVDKWYQSRNPPYNYKAMYVKGKNGA